MSQLQFELVTPEKLYVSKPVAMVTVPGGEGEYGVLSGHAPMITTVKPGVIGVYADHETTLTERIFVAGGFAEITADRCSILAEEAVSVVHIDRESTLLRIKLLTESLSATMGDAERSKIESELAVSQAKIEALAA
jgi:F-type H+-transporting ATPase subunit epsilon